MRTEKQMETRHNRAKNANALLAWLHQKKHAAGTKVSDEIIIPFSEKYGLEPWDIWRAWDILKKAGRCKSLSCWEWEVLSTAPIEVQPDGAYK